MTKKQIVFVRHAAGSHQDDQHKSYNCGNITAKSISGLPISYQDEFYQDCMLNTKGHEQATKLGLYFDSIKKSFNHVYCSPIRRVIETCDHVVKKKNVFINDNLIELNCTSNCNRKHNIDYLKRFIFPRDNCYDLSNIDDNYNPDKILAIEINIDKLEKKEIIQPIIKKLEVDLWEIFKNIPNRNLKFIEEPNGGKIKLKEVISFLRISNFVENILEKSEVKSGDIIVFTHGEWITYLKRLYLNLNEKTGNCTYHTLNLENLDSEFIRLIKESNQLINDVYNKIFLLLVPADILKLNASQYPDNYVIDEKYKYKKYKIKYDRLLRENRI